MVTLVNPYGDMTTILDPTKLIGRLDALEYLYAEISARRNVAIVGTRRIGKSSLLRCLCRPEVQQRFAPYYDLGKTLLVFLDVGEYLASTRENFFEAVCAQMIEQSRGRLDLELPEDVDEADCFWQLLEQVQQQEHHTVLLLDAFHNITSNTEFDPKFFAFMRAQANHGRVSYVTASSKPLNECCHPYIEGSPFFNIFNAYPLGPLEEVEVRQLVEGPARAVGSPFSEGEVAEIIRLAGRHPFFVQRVAFYLFKEKNQQAMAAAPVKRQRRFKQEAYQDLFAHFKDIWEHTLSEQQRAVLREEALWKDVKVRRHPELSESALFRQFVCETCNMQPFDLTSDYLEDLLNNFSNTKYLGESELTHLYLFAARTPNVTMSRSAVEKGVIVRNILREARDKLQPEGEPSYKAPEWQCYNILNLRYFRDHLRNEILAEKLSISVRQLHRERKLAIEALREVLNEMEYTAKADLEDA